jgi:hypothetical protein
MATLNWFDMMATEEDTAEDRMVRMTAEEWRAEARSLIRTWRGDLRQCITFLDAMDARRAAYGAAQPAVQEPRIRTEFDVDFALWRDMIDEPAKYGDDIGEWLELNERLTQGPGRWRLGAFWDQKQAELEDTLATLALAETSRRRTEAATVIQSAIRGHLARAKQPFRDCCMCLSHRISPLVTDVGCMCRGCAEQGPYTEETGPIADPWSEFRGDFVDPVQPAPIRMCRYCETTLPAGVHEFCDEICREYLADEEEFNLGNAASGQHTARHGQCHNCFCPLDEGQTGDFCDRDCEYSYMKEAWRSGH